MRASLSTTAVAAATLCAAMAAPGWQVVGAEVAPVPPQADTTILGNDSCLRVYLGFATPVSITADGQIQVPLEPTSKEPKPVEPFQSPLPPAEWTHTEFDDSTWERKRAPVEVKPAGATGHSHAARHSATCSALVCLRGRFVVDDPAKVQHLKLSLEYVGGLAVYLNGREVARAHLPAGALRPDTLAEQYPDDLYCEPGGMFLQDIKKNPQGFERRYRRLTDVAIPAKLLRKGVNVLAVEVHRAPINEAAVAAKRVAVGGMYVIPGIWSYAGLRSLDLTAAPGSALAPNLSRPKGIQVWNCLPSETIQATDYGDPGEPLRPVAVPAARNGVFSGRLVVGSDEALRGLKVRVSELVLAGGGATIPASAVQVRCAVPAVPGKSWAPTYRFDALLETIPDEVAVVKTALPREEHLGQPLPRSNLGPGALAPIWLTVRIPADAKAGQYQGKVTLAAEGLPPTSVPLHVTVYNWSLPDPKHFRVQNFAMHEAENLALHYGVPLWSDRHFELLGTSMALMAQANSRLVVLNLANHFYGVGGNSQSVVRWVRKPDGSFGHDFTLFDKYLDVVARSIGKPALLRLNCWAERRSGALSQHATTVSLLDPATGKIETLEQPPPGTPESFAFWKPVLDEVRRRVEARGWWDVTAVGHTSYCYEPAKEVVSVYKQLWPDGVWSYTAHNGRLDAHFLGTEAGVTMPIRYAGCVWTEGRLTARGYSALLEPRKTIWYSLARDRFKDWSPLSVLRDLPEEMIMRGHDGVGDFGADVFPLRDAQGRYRHLDVTKCAVGPDCSTLAMLAAGPDGPVPSERFEMFREGVQLTEAILSLQRALQQKTIDGELAEQVNRYLDHRAEAFLRHWSSGRFERDERLLALAAQAATRSLRSEQK